MDYTDNFSFAQPEEGSSNSGQAYNGNMDTIDLHLFAAKNIITKNGDIVTKNGDILYKST